MAEASLASCLPLAPDETFAVTDVTPGSYIASATGGSPASLTGQGTLTNIDTNRINGYIHIDAML